MTATNDSYVSFSGEPERGEAAGPGWQQPSETRSYVASRRLDVLRRKLEWALARGDYLGAILLAQCIRRELEDPR